MKFEGGRCDGDYKWASWGWVFLFCLVDLTVFCPLNNLVTSQLRCEEKGGDTVASEQMIYKPKGTCAHIHTERERE